MAFEEININMTLTGSQAVVQELMNYIKNMAESNKVTVTFSDAAKKAGASLGALGKEMGAAAGRAGKYAASTATANAETQRSIAAQDRAAAAYMRQTHAIERAAQATLIQRDALAASVAKQQTAMQSFANSAPKLTRMATWSIGLIGGAVYEGIKQYTDFNKKMVQASTEAGISFDKQAQLTKNIGQIAKDTGRSYNDLADALYRVGSATSGWNSGKGASTGQITDLVRQTANLATIGNLSSGAQSDQAARVIGAVVNSGMAKGGTKNAAAQINAIVGAGDIRMSEFITALGRGVLTSGKSVGLDLKQVGAYVDLLTSRGVTGASAGTYVAHAFQLLAGSTSQAAGIQGALGIESGKMTDIMKNQGLGPAVQYLYEHMQKLQAVPYLQYGGATGQAAAEKMMLKMGLSPDQVSAMEQGLTPGSDMQRAVMQRLMTGMFGGGRQAMPLMTLMQTSGIDISSLDKSMGGYMANGPSYQDILKNIDSHSTNSHYDKVLKASLDTPAAKQAKLMRQLQGDFIEFGKTVYPIWINLLHGVTILVSGLMKLKGALYGVAIAVGGLLLAAGVKGAANLAMRAKDTIGAASYWRTRGLTRLAGGDLKNVTLSKSAEAYASKRGLEGSEVYRNQLRQIAIADAQLAVLRGILMERGSQNLIRSPLKGESKSLLSRGLRNEQIIQNLERGHPGYIGRASGLLVPTKTGPNLSSINANIGKMAGVGSKAAGIGEEVASVASKGGMLTRLLGLGGGLGGMMAGGGIKGILGAALGLGTGGLGMAAMTAITLGPVIAPMVAPIAKSIFGAIGGGLSSLFGGGGTNSAPPKPPKPPTPLKSVPPNVKKLTDRMGTLNQQLKAAQRSGDMTAQETIKEEMEDTYGKLLGLTSDNPQTRYLTSVSMARESTTYANKHYGFVNKRKFVGNPGGRGGKWVDNWVRKEGWKPKEIPRWAMTQQEKDASDKKATAKYLGALQTQQALSGGKVTKMIGGFFAGQPVLTTSGGTVVQLDDKQQRALKDPNLYARSLFGSGTVPGFRSRSGKYTMGYSALMKNKDNIFKEASHDPEQMEAAYKTYTSQAGIEYSRSQSLRKRAQQEISSGAPGSQKKAAVDLEAAKKLEEQSKHLRDAADTLKKNLKLDPATMSQLAQEIGDSVRRGIGKRISDGVGRG